MQTLNNFLHQSVQPTVLIYHLDLGRPLPSKRLPNTSIANCVHVYGLKSKRTQTETDQAKQTSKRYQVKTCPHQIGPKKSKAVRFKSKVLD